MTAIEILKANEEAYRRRDTISSTLAIGNRAYPDLSILKLVLGLVILLPDYHSS